MASGCCLFEPQVLVLLAVQLDDHWRALAVAASPGTKLLSLSAWMIVIVRLLHCG
ncbi:MAG: hypothetical protein R3C56_29470 [Pirellulaceae bacterium]